MTEDRELAHLSRRRGDEVYALACCGGGACARGDCAAQTSAQRGKLTCPSGREDFQRVSLAQKASPVMEESEEAKLPEKILQNPKR